MTESKNLSTADIATTASFEPLARGQRLHAKDSITTDHKWYRRLLGLPAYYWVLIAQVAVVLPHAAHLPLWLIGFAAISIIAQLPRIKSRFKKHAHLKRVYQGMQMLGFLLGLAGLWLTYNTAFGLDMGVAFLVLA